MPVEAPIQTAESHMQGERLYRSFIDGLQLVSALERRYASKVAGIDAERLSDIEHNFSSEELVSLTNNLRDLYYGRDERSSKYDSLIDMAVAHNIEPEPDKYSALADPDVLAACKGLARWGLLSEVTQYRVDNARMQQHQHMHGLRHTAVNGINHTLRKAARVDELIAFNHMTRDLADGPLGKMMNLDRHKMQEILRIVMLGDRQTAETLEHGTAIEIAAMKIFRHDLGMANTSYGDIPQDRQGGDIILFPRTEGQVLVDVKQTPPNEIRDQLAPEAIRTPGIYWRSNRAAYLWLGTEQSIGNQYGPPAEFVSKARELLQQVTVETAVA